MRPLLFALAVLGLLVNGLALAEPTKDELPELSSALSLFSAFATDTNGIRINWNLDHQSPTIVKYRLYRGYEEVGNFAVLTEVEARPVADAADYSFSDVSARPGVSYFYKLAALGQKNESVFPVVITATTGTRKLQLRGAELPPAAVLSGDKIALYVRKAGRVKLEALTTPVKVLVNDRLKPGIYEFDVPAGGEKGVNLRLEHENGYKHDSGWPVH